MTETKKEEKKKTPQNNNLNIYQKLVEVRKQVEKLKKDAIGKGGKKDAPFEYLYTSGDSILSALRPKLDELNVLVLCKIVEDSITDDNRVTVHVIYSFINADNPTEIIELPWVGYGKQSDPSKALGSALTYQERYFFKKNNLIPTDQDDPDAQPPGNGKKSSQESHTHSQSSKSPTNGTQQETLGKISAACMWLGGGNPDNAKSYFRSHAKYTYPKKDTNETVTRAPQELKDLTPGETNTLWGKLKTYFQNQNLDMEAALKEYGNKKGGE